MDSRKQLSIDKPYRLPPFFLVANPDCRRKRKERIIKHPRSKGQRQPVLEPVSLILAGIKFDGPVCVIICKSHSI